MGQPLMPKHDFVPNDLNDYCLTCDLPLYSAVHEAVEAGEFIDVTTLATNRYIIGKPDHADLTIRAVEAQQKAKRLGDLIDSGRLVTSVWAPVKGEAWTAKDVARAFGIPPWWL